MERLFIITRSDCKPPAAVLQLTCACVATPACVGPVGLSAHLQVACAGVIFRGWIVCFCLCELGGNQTQLQTLPVFMFLLSNKPFQCIFKISSFYFLLISSYNSLFWLISSSFQKENLTALLSEVPVIVIFASSLCSCSSWLVPSGRSFPWACGLDLFPSFYLKY